MVILLSENLVETANFLVSQTAPAPTPTQSSGSVTGLLDGLAFFAD